MAEEASWRASLTKQSRRGRIRRAAEAEGSAVVESVRPLQSGSGLLLLGIGGGRVDFAGGLGGVAGKEMSHRRARSGDGGGEFAVDSSDDRIDSVGYE